MKKKGGNLICMRPDSIVEARFKLTRRQNDIMDMVFASIEDDDKLEYEIDLSKYAKLYNVKDVSDIYGEIKKAVKTFEGKGFAITRKISETKENRIYFSWFSSIEYLDGEGKIKVELGQKLKSLFLQVKRATFYDIQYTLNLKSIYSKRLYYYLKLYEDKGFRIDKIDELKDKLECPVGYKNYADFNRYVLNTAYEEINGNSDISFEYEKEYTGKKVTHIKFIIKSNKKVNAPKEIQADKEVVADKETPLDIIENDIKLIMEITENRFKEDNAMTFRTESKGDIELIRKVYQYMKCELANGKEIPKKVGYIITLLRNFDEPQELEKVGINYKGFNNFEPRDYDYDKLEKQLLGWED